MSINRELVLSNDKPIYDITPFSTIDYPHHLTAIFWFAGCNMRCEYCYNKGVVFGKGKISENEALEFLKTRVNLLDSVTLSGGECTLYKNLPLFCKEIKKLGFKIKLDTNGINFVMIERLIRENLIDFIALDYKAPFSKFSKITKSKEFKSFKKSLKLLIKTNFLFEVRTTLHSDLLNLHDINEIIEDLAHRGYKNRYYIQNFVYETNTIGNLPEQTLAIDKTKISKKIDIEYRNF